MIVAELAGEGDRAGWRDLARRLLGANAAPDEVVWRVVGRATSGDLFTLPGAVPPPRADALPLHVARDLIGAIDAALLHRDEGRFHLAYRMVWRARAEPGFHRNPADPDVARLAAMAKAVRRDIHKMHAFVRFRETSVDGRPRYVAWFEPDHHIVEAVAGFFRDRFTGMDWVIVTPEATIAWDGQAVRVGPGGTRADVPAGDAVEDEWRTYYASIFNPARVKIGAMKSEMPVKYWRNLPEASLIQSLIADAPRRVATMVASVSVPAAALSLAPAAAEGPPHGRFTALDPLYAALAAADTPPRPGFADNLVGGEGPCPAPVMFVGEQPGDQEDLTGRPFVGPAGQMFDNALSDAGIDRCAMFVTNAVKRFKFVPRGSRRIHSKPSTADIAHYRWWLEEERLIVAPRLVVALGATAAQALTGQTVTVSRVRGQIIPYRDGTDLLVTVHPSFLLRLPDDSGRAIEFGRFVRDLALAARHR